MRNKFLLKEKVLLLVVSIFIGCQTERDDLVYDEIIFEKYKTEFLYADNEEELKEELKKYVLPYKPFKFHMNFLYTPLTILHIGKDGKVVFFKHDNDQESERGYFKSFLSNSGMKYFNNILAKVNYQKIDTLYYYINEPNSISCFDFDTPKYYLSLRKGSEIKFSHIESIKDTPKGLRRLVEYLFYLEDKLKFKKGDDSILITKISNKIFDSELKVNKWDYELQGLIKFTPPE